MRSTFILSLVFLCANVCEAQVTDNFSDGDFSNAPVWLTDNPANWTVTSTNQLRSNSPALNSGFYISTPSTKAVNVQWELFMNLQFNTSSANYVDVYLTSNLADLNNPANSGYFVRIGGTPDEISLYKISSGTAIVLINGTDGITNTSNNTLRIKVIRDASNRWTLERDISGTGNSYVPEGTATDNTFSTSQFFGIKIQQSTATFLNKHFFDDIYVGDIIIDSAPPIIASLEVSASTVLTLAFSEKPEATSAQRKTNYQADHDVGNPETAVLQPDGKTVILTFLNPFSNGITFHLMISGVTDLAGNQIVTTTKAFLFFIPGVAKKKDVIVTEFFPDPSPQVGLPDDEFIEIYNRSEEVFDLKNWKLSDGNSVALFPAKTLLPHEYLIIVSASAVSKFAVYDNVLGVPNFPTLNNSTDTLTLKDPNNILIDSINYDLSWYQDQDKQQGGWTLELIDINNPCGEQDNWVASDAAKGGTPGKQNSVFATKPDLAGPHLEKVVVLQPDRLLLTFNEKLESLATSGFFTITPAVEIDQASFTNHALTTIQLDLVRSLQTQKLYSLKVDNLRDCSGNVINPQFSEIKFAVPEPADSLDILVNEILFNPRPGGFDFVELYNNSPKFINITDWQISNISAGKITNGKSISLDNLVFAPGSYIVFTQDRMSLKTFYTSTIEKHVFELSLSGMSDDEGSIALVDNNGRVIDHFSYSDKFHSELIKDPEGISLERISFSAPTNDQQNWKSANSASGFATPTYVNSNARPESLLPDGRVYVEPQFFIPDSGSPDFTKINYRFDQSGLIANIKIYDQQGHFIKTLANNQTLPYEGFFRWDGDRDDGTRARIGYYLVWFEVFDLTGSVKTFRERVVIAGN